VIERIYQMKILSVTKAKGILVELLEEVASNHGPIYIKGKDTSAVLLDEDDWRAIQETLYLLSIPGMRESIREGLETPLNECSESVTEKLITTKPCKGEMFIEM